MKLALVTLNDSADVAQWSGLNYHIARALERAGATLQRVGPLQSRWTPLMKLRQRWYDATRQSYHASYDPAAVAAMGAAARAAIPPDADAVLAVTWQVAGAIGPLEVPLVSWDDSTFAAMMHYYPDYRRIATPSVREGAALGERATRSVTLALYASHWAAASARAAYGMPDERIAVVPFGANLDPLPDASRIQAAIAGRSTTVCRLLWVGVDWERKGGAQAVEIAAVLRAEGVPVALTMVGCAPPAGTTLPPWVRLEGFISKRTRDGEARLATLFGEAHFFVMPSRAEAYGLVFAEAAAFGVPAVGLRTGGVPTIVLDGETGLLDEPAAPAALIAARMLALWRDRPAYERMARAARRRAELHLNWDVAGRDALSRIERVVHDSRR